jgi:hypothetical protein
MKLSIVTVIAFICTSSAQLFAEAVPVCSLGVAVKNIVCANFDGNPYHDILLEPWMGGNMILIMNDGSGFADPVEIPWQGMNARTADFNGDGLCDIATGVTGPILFSNGDGTFTPSSYSVSGNTVPEDFNSDGMPDLLMGAGVNFHLALNQNWGEGFETVWSGTIPSWPGVHVTGFFTGDIAGDPFTDFAVLFSYGLRVYQAQGGWDSFVMVEAEDDLYTYLNGCPPYWQCDINGDGHPDLLHSAWDIYPSPPPPLKISMWVNDPGAWYWPLATIEANYLPTVQGCDFNGDGFDEVFYSSTEQVTVIAGTPSGLGETVFSDAQYGCDAVGYGMLSGGPNPDLVTISGNWLYWYQNLSAGIESETHAGVQPVLELSSNPFSGFLRVTSSVPGGFRLYDLGGRLLACTWGTGLDFAPVGLRTGGLLLEFTGGGSRIVEKLIHLSQ